jgi:AraC-like DNA-binding protein
MDWTTSLAESVMIDFLGYNLSVETSDLTGGPWYQFGDQPVTLRIPYFDQQKTMAQARLPEAYIIPPQWLSALECVHDHGLASFTLRERVVAPVSTVRFRDVAWAASPYEGHHPLTYAWDEIIEERTLEPGTVVIDLSQPGVRIAAHIFEPAGPDALVRWGFFDAAFEQKEYIESYVIEALAREMLKSDSTLAREFAAMQKTPGFAESPQWIRDWFYQHSPYFDARQNIYPAGRILDRATVDRLARFAR